MDVTLTYCQVLPYKISLVQAKWELLKLGPFWEHCVGNVGIPSLLPGQSADGFDVVSNLSLLPKFHDKQPETFFILFEYIADAGVCLDFEASVCVLTSKSTTDIQYSLLPVSLIMRP